MHDLPVGGIGCDWMLRALDGGLEEVITLAGTETLPYNVAREAAKMESVMNQNNDGTSGQNSCQHQKGLMRGWWHSLKETMRSANPLHVAYGVFLVLAGVGTLAWGLCSGEFKWVLALTVLAALLLFGERLAIRLREMSVKAGGVEICIGLEPSATTQAVPDVVPPSLGTVRDNFIFLAHHFRMNGDHATAFQHYFAAHRMRKSILTAYYAVECLCREYRDRASVELAQWIVDWFDDAVWLCGRPHEELEGRQGLVERVQSLNRQRDEAEAFLQLLLDQLAPAEQGDSPHAT